MTSSPTVFLVPGFFGFTNLAGIAYFAQVQLVLDAALKGRGVEPRIVGVKTFPTASLERRARRLAEVIAQEAPEGSVHIVGHSTGGLDARIVASPGAGCDADEPLFERLRPRIESVTAVATPHRGTPMAEFFARYNAGALVKVLSLLAVHATRVGPVPMHVIAALPPLLAGEGPPNATVLQTIYERLLKDFSPDARGVLTEFLDQMSEDQTLIPQLQPERVAELTASWSLAAHIRGACVVTQSRRPSFHGVRELGLNPSAHLLHMLFRWMQQLSGWKGEGPSLTPFERDLLQAGFGSLHHAANDGVVPTTSQVWQQPLALAWADHLDVVGHFKGPELRPPHYDWLPSGSQFRRPEFVRVWEAVAGFIASSPSVS